jgi:hypothetical protein
LREPTSARAKNRNSAELKGGPALRSGGRPFR